MPFETIRELLLANNADPVSAISKVTDDLGHLLGAPSTSDKLLFKLESLETLLSVVHKEDPDGTGEVERSPAEVAVEYHKLQLQTRIFDQICLKLFSLISTGIQKPASVNAMLQKHLSSLLGHSFPKVPTNKQEALLSMCLNAFNDYIEERKLAYGDTAERASIQCAIKTLNSVLYTQSLQDTNHSPMMERIFNSVMQLISVADNNTVGNVIGLLLPKLLGKGDAQLRRQIQELWHLAIDVFEQHGQKTFQCKIIVELSERPSLLLCGLADFLFPVTGFGTLSLDLFADFRFWTMLQASLFSRSLLTRKRGMYMLKRILDIAESGNQAINVDGKETSLFWWESSERTALFKLWQDVILLLETLEEKQVFAL